MSYTLEKKCGTCKKSDKCIDADFVMGSIYGIHGVNRFNMRTNQNINRGHLGCGTIRIECSNFEQIPDGEKPA